MKYFALNLTAVSPLAIRADHAPGGVANARYISGGALMGSLAMIYRLMHEEHTAEFEHFFLQEQIAYPNLYPAVFQHPDMQNEREWPVYPVPMTARTCKRAPGFMAFRNDEIDDERHGVRDSLFEWAMFKLASISDNPRSQAKRLKFLDNQKKCSTCEKALKTFSGFYRCSQRGNRPMIAATSRTRVQTHTGINRETGTVQEGILYSREVFTEQTCFWGLLKVPDELVAPFKDFLGQVGKSGLVRLGTGRSRGLGKVHLSATPLPGEQYEFAAFKQRLEAFDAAFRKQAQEADPALKLDPFYFALTLHAPAILRDDLLRYRGDIDEDTLAELSGLPADSFRAVYQATSTRRVTGWNELWGTPRASEYALETGSVFFFAAHVEPREKLLQALFHLEQEGIGQRRAEGFGRVCVSDPFHLEVTLK